MQMRVGLKIILGNENGKRESRWHWRSLLHPLFTQDAQFWWKSGEPNDKIVTSVGQDAHVNPAEPIAHKNLVELVLPIAHVETVPPKLKNLKKQALVNTVANVEPNDTASLKKKSTKKKHMSRMLQVLKMLRMSNT